MVLKIEAAQAEISMARYRTIKPEFWTSEQVMECSRNARLLFIGIWNFCDDEGRHPWAPKQLRALIFPADELSVNDVDALLVELSTVGLIKKYAANEREYFAVTGWKHQRIEKPQPARYPCPSGECSETVPGPLPERSGNGTEPFGPGIEKNRIERKEECMGRSPEATRPLDTKKAFQEFWSVYPKRQGANPKAPAERKFDAAVKSGVDPPDVVAAARRYAAEIRQIGKEKTEFVAQAVTWLNQKRWNDYPPATEASKIEIPSDIPPELHADYLKGWRPGMPTSAELLARANGNDSREEDCSQEPEGEGVLRNGGQIHQLQPGRVIAYDIPKLRKF